LISRVALLALVSAGACVPEPGELDVNEAPVARVVVPQLWPASVPATIDGRFSGDDDGDPLRFVVDWGDGTPAAEDDDGVAQHAYGAPGTFALELLVEDPGALSSRVQASVVIVGDDDSGCSCELGCFDDAVCTTGGCLLFRSALADEEAPETALPPLDC
jgi:hypothetical protein